jgi:hypothetical protein
MVLLIGKYHMADCYFHPCTHMQVHVRLILAKIEVGLLDLSNALDHYGIPRSIHALTFHSLQRSKVQQELRGEFDAMVKTEGVYIWLIHILIYEQVPATQWQLCLGGSLKQ